MKRQMRKQLEHIVVLLVLVLGLATIQNGHAATGRLDIEPERLLAMIVGGYQAHEGYPMGVPRDYDWSQRAQLRTGNEPGGFAAITGWGQLFWEQGSGGDPQSLQIRNFQLFVCHGDKPIWTRLQHGNIAGKEFRADFKDNINSDAPFFEQVGTVSTVKFDHGSAFHFWPASGQVKLPDGPICGILVLAQGRFDPAFQTGDADALANNYLIGLGADYWLYVGAKWDGHRTNKGVAVGRLMRITHDWTWFGMSTASEDSLLKLLNKGFHE